MITIGGVECCEESLIEICVLPDVSTGQIIAELSAQNPKSILVENTLNLSLFGLNAFYVSDHREFLRFLDTVKHTWLFIDSIALYVDTIREVESESMVKKLYNKLWELIYDRRVTIVVINHFKVKRDPIYCRITPRLGFSWYKMCSYRIFVSRNKESSLEYKVTRNKMIDQ